ncbi:hypothetical protein D3C77_507360 [compost metagenome]
MPERADHILFDHVLGQAHAFGDFRLGQAFELLPDEHPTAIERQLRQGALHAVGQLNGMHIGLRVAMGVGARREGVLLQGLAPVFTAVAIDGNVARCLVQVGAWLLDPGLVIFQHPDKGIMSQILGLLAIAQLARPGADQFMVVVEKAFVSRHDAGVTPGNGGRRE